MATAAGARWRWRKTSVLLRVEIAAVVATPMVLARLVLRVIVVVGGLLGTVPVVRGPLGLRAAV